jgi:outer membrane immunogenic protein
MRRQFLAGAGAVAMMAGSAFAADMPVKAIAPVAIYDWSGMYIGGVFGGAWGNNDISDPSNALLAASGAGFGTSPYILSSSSSAFIGGIEGGSRYQFGKLVVGWEGDITWGDLNASSNTAFPPGVSPGPALGFTGLTHSVSADTKWTATAVTTIGVAHNNWLLYGKAGAAWENVSYTEGYTISSPAATVSLFTGTGSDNRAGWTVGTGIEWAVWSNWSIKAEYDYLDFGTRNVAINGSSAGLGTGFVNGIQDNSHISQVKVGVNWRPLPNFW